MNEKTYNLMVLLKYFELIYNLLLFAFMIYSVTLFSYEHSNIVTIVLAYLMLVMAGFRIAYNTLLTNMRFDLLRHGVIGSCAYFLVNKMILRTYCKKLCTDRLCTIDGTPNVYFVIKTSLELLICVFYAVLAHLTYKEQPDSWEAGNQHKMPFVALAFLYTFQHLIFIILRPFFFILFLLLTCFCDCGQENTFADDEPF